MLFVAYLHTHHPGRDTSSSACRQQQALQHKEDRAPGWGAHLQVGAAGGGDLLAVRRQPRAELPDRAGRLRNALAAANHTSCTMQAVSRRLAHQNLGCTLLAVACRGYGVYLTQNGLSGSQNFGTHCRIMASRSCWTSGDRDVPCKAQQGNICQHWKRFCRTYLTVAQPLRKCIPAQVMDFDN